jgi:hypothetical protein
MLTIKNLSYELLHYVTLSIILLLPFSYKKNCPKYPAFHYATSRKVAGLRPDEENFSIYLILPAALCPGVHSASNRNEYQKQKNNVSRE